MSSAVARPMRSSSKKLTSSTSAIPRISVARLLVQEGLRSGPPWRPGPSRSDFVDADHAFVRSPGEVDAQFLGGPEDLVVRLTHLQGHPIAGEHLDIQT